MNHLTTSPKPLVLQVFQWVFETDFVFLFCKSQKDKRIILKVHSLNLKSYVLVDDATSLTEDLLEEFQTFLRTNSFPCHLTSKKRFGSFFDATGDNHRSWKFVEITHPSNGKPMYFLRNIMKSFERKYDISLKTFHMKIDPVTRLFQHHRNLKPCMFVELNTDDPLIKYNPRTSIRISKGVHRTIHNYQADAMYSLPISKLKTCPNPPPFNFPLRVVAFDFECSGAVFEKDYIYQVSFVFETVFVQEGSEVQKNSRHFLLNVGDCDKITMENGTKVVVKSFKTEKGLLLEMMSLLVYNDWDCITGYNIYGFDFPMLEARLRKYGLLGLLSKWNRLGSSNNKIGTFHKKISGKGEGYLSIIYPQLMGRFHLDVQPVIVKNFRLKSYSLKNVTTKFLGGETKIDLPFDCCHLKPCSIEGCKSQKSLYKLGTSVAFAEIGIYCVVDSELCISLVKKLNVIGNQIEFANVALFSLEHLFTSGEMRKIGAGIFVNGYELDFLFEDQPYEEGVVTSGKKYQGALVLGRFIYIFHVLFFMFSHRIFFNFRT